VPRASIRRRAAAKRHRRGHGFGPVGGVGQWIRRAGQADLARLRAPWDPIADRYRAPDEKTIRVVLDRLDPRALTQGPAAAGRPRPACAAAQQPPLR